MENNCTQELDAIDYDLQLFLEQVNSVEEHLNQPEREEKAKETLAELASQYGDKLSRLDLAAELWAERKKSQQLSDVMYDLAQAKEDDRTHIMQLKARVARIKELALDRTTLTGQVDIGIWSARELSLARFLNPEFKRVLHNQNRLKGGDRSTRHESNSLLHRDLDSMVARRSKETKVSYHCIIFQKYTLYS